ncbi:hypothetical protein PIB30_021741 [Stylosanthes scabra]|uniref:Aminotransferase-like plant mobile domain-containing protein n=1 Tax=Stylosanthes scabra TaxID=79078 RepID=A0ABU6T8Q8_9FABA|nr:hypothetical protein [Stylosanthes scabra]
MSPVSYDRVIPQFGGVQNRPHRALNIDFLHAKDGRGSDQWFPQTFQRWHALWGTRFEHLFQVVPSADPGLTADFLRWWILAGRRYLVLADRFHHLPPDEIPVEAMQRQSDPHPPRPDVPHEQATCEEDDGWDEDHRSGLAVVGRRHG